MPNYIVGHDDAPSVPEEPQIIPTNPPNVVQDDAPAATVPSFDVNDDTVTIVAQDDEPHPDIHNDATVAPEGDVGALNDEEIAHVADGATERIQISQDDATEGNHVVVNEVQSDFQVQQDVVTNNPVASQDEVEIVPDATEAVPIPPSHDTQEMNEVHIVHDEVTDSVTPQDDVNIVEAQVSHDEVTEKFEPVQDEPISETPAVQDVPSEADQQVLNDNVEDHTSAPAILSDHVEGHTSAPEFVNNHADEQPEIVSDHVEGHTSAPEIVSDHVEEQSAEIVSDHVEGHTSAPEVTGDHVEEQPEILNDHVEGHTSAPETVSDYAEAHTSVPEIVHDNGEDESEIESDHVEGHTSAPETVSEDVDVEPQVVNDHVDEQSETMSDHVEGHTTAPEIVSDHVETHTSAPEFVNDQAEVVNDHMEGHTSGPEIVSDHEEGQPEIMSDHVEEGHTSSEVDSDHVEAQTSGPEVVSDHVEGHTSSPQIASDHVEGHTSSPQIEFHDEEQVSDVTEQVSVNPPSNNVVNEEIQAVQDDDPVTTSSVPAVSHDHEEEIHIVHDEVTEPVQVNNVDEQQEISSAVQDEQYQVAHDDTTAPPAVHDEVAPFNDEVLADVGQPQVVEAVTEKLTNDEASEPTQAPQVEVEAHVSHDDATEAPQEDKHNHEHIEDDNVQNDV